MKKIILSLLVVLTLFLNTQAAYTQTLTPLWKTDTLLRVPESVLLDVARNILYVSNINGKSDEKNGNGFISKVSTEGKIITRQWVTGLDAPKGMGLYKNNLYIADLDRVVIVDVTSGKIINTIAIEGAQFLNDITVDTKGNIYISDSSTGQIHFLHDNKATLYFQSTEFKRINGLLALGYGLYIADAGTGINYKLSKDKKLMKFSETSQGADGIVDVGNGDYIVSSWGGEVFFVDSKGRSYKLLDTKEQKLNAADIEYNAATKTLYVPTFFGNTVMAYEFLK